MARPGRGRPRAPRPAAGRKRVELKATTVAHLIEYLQGLDPEEKVAFRKMREVRPGTGGPLEGAKIFAGVRDLEDGDIEESS